MQNSKFKIISPLAHDFIPIYFTLFFLLRCAYHKKKSVSADGLFVVLRSDPRKMVIYLCGARFGAS